MPMETAVITNWNLDTVHSEIAFKVKHMMISTVTGHFSDFNATAETTSNDFINAEFNFVATVASIQTKNKDRDNHLKSDDFFGAATYPEIMFTSTSFNGSKMEGDLTIKGVTRQINLDVDFNGIVVDPYGQTKAGFEISGKINRKDFGLDWGAVTETGSIVVGDVVQLDIDLQFIRD